jgi:hypothetical protein
VSRAPILILAVLVAFNPCYAAKPVRAGSTKATAIRLIQRDPTKAVEEEMAWMMKLFHYTPLLATRDELADAIRRMKAGQKQVKSPNDWGHASLDYNGRLISNWWFATPRGKREIYFDTGTLINTPGEVARQESARGAYIVRMVSTLKLQ